MENLFVIFAPGCAGNHLANIISTSNRFTKRYTDDIYDASDVKAHPSENRNYELTERDFLALQNQSNIFCSHLAEYLVSRSLTEKYLQNRKYVIVEMPPESRNNFFINRTSSLYPVYRDLYFFEEISMLYSIQNFSRLVNETDMTSVTVDRIFFEDAEPLVIKLNSELGLNLDITTVSAIHTKWIEKNKQYV